jgi:hypothetical protein
MPHILRLALVIVAVSACSDPVSAPAITDPIVIPAVGVQSFVGTLEQRDGNLWLRRDAGSSIRLMGPESAALSSVIGADIEVRGTADGSDDGFVVGEFTVRAVGGQPAADGILESLEEGLALRLANRSLRMIIDPPAELARLVGKRVWIAGPADQCPVGYGVISPAE